MCSETKHVVKSIVILVLCLVLLVMSIWVSSLVKALDEYKDNYKECNNNYKMLQLKINYMIEAMPEVVKHYEAWQRIEANISQYYASQLIRGGLE